MAIEQTFTWLMTSGAYDALLPFFLIFTLVFAFLQKVNMFGEGNNKKFNVMLALIIGLMVVVPHVTNSYPRGADPITIMQEALPNVILWVVAIFALWLLMAALGLPVTFGQSTAGMQGFLTITAVTAGSAYGTGLSRYQNATRVVRSRAAENTRRRAARVRNTMR